MEQTSIYVLEMLGCAVETWDVLVIHILFENLDKVMARE